MLISGTISVAPPLGPEPDNEKRVWFGYSPLLSCTVRFVQCVSCPFLASHGSFASASSSSLSSACYYWEGSGDKINGVWRQKQNKKIGMDMTAWLLLLVHLSSSAGFV